MVDSTNKAIKITENSDVIIPPDNIKRFHILKNNLKTIKNSDNRNNRALRRQKRKRP